MDILYVHPAKQEVDARYDKYVSCSPYPYIPVGVVGLVNLLIANGWDVQGINLPLELTMQPSFDFVAWLRAQAPPRLVMVDLHWYEHSFGALDVARAVKRVWSHVPVVIGGLTTTHFAEEILTHFAEVDFAIRGDAEEPLRQLAAYIGRQEGTPATIPNLVYRDEGRLCINARTYGARPEELDRLDFVTMDWLLHQESYAATMYYGAGRIALHDPRLRGHWLTIGRGCVFNCIYCGGGKHSHEGLAGRNGYVMRSPALVAGDVMRLAEKGTKQVALSLDPATFGPEWWQPFFRLVREGSVRIGLYNEFFQLPSGEFIRALGETFDLEHTEVAISPLSGDEEVRRRNGKFYTNERFLRMLATLRDLRVPIFIYFSLNLPGETFKTFKSTLQLAYEVGKVYPHELLRMLNPCHTLDPVSPMSMRPDAYGMEVHYTSFMDYYNYCKGTGWQPRQVIRGQHRGFELKGRPAQVVEQMAQTWDIFARQQRFRCFPVPRGW